MLATGRDFPDALAGGAAAARVGGAVLLTDGAGLPPATASYLAAHPEAVRYALGGPAAAADPGAIGLVGADRYETAVAVARHFFVGVRRVGVADGERFADALAGGAHIGLRGGPLVLVAPDRLPPAVEAWLASVASGVETVFVYGGPVAVSETVLQAIERTLG